MKKKIPYLLFTCLFVYVVIALTFAASKRDEVLCTGVSVTIADADANSFIEEVDVERLMRRGYGELLEHRINQIDKDKLEQLLINNSVIKSAEMYFDLGGTLHVDVTQRRPVLRVMNSKEGGGYYVDDEGEIMPLSGRYSARVVIGSGNISRKFAVEKLYPYALLLREDAFWDAYIEQIVVKSESHIILIPKVGNFDIILGSLDNAEMKMEKLRYFLKDGIAKKGWDAYKEINLKFGKQVVCVKRSQ
ncbi:hypothetical protein FACS1894199_05420 [Bacteroidia bacterium]|nr:hypothetical protein FACS1894199_05420 [Bacteroidia bacterium]